MSNDIDALTTSSTAIFALFAALAASACDEPEGPAARAAQVAEDDEDGPAPTLQEAPPPKGFSIEKVTTGGKGCPEPASVAVLMSADKTRLRIIYDQMILKALPGTPVQTISCTAALKLRIPVGWRVAPVILKTQGYAYLDENIIGRRHTDIAFAGVPGGPKFDTHWKGPNDDVYQATDVVMPGAAAWSPCGGSALLSISNSLVLNAVANPKGGALLNLHDQRLLAWQFKKC
jgi:hypothetical protein